MVKKCVRRCLMSLIIQKGFCSAQLSLKTQNRVGNSAALLILSCHPRHYMPHGDGLNKVLFSIVDRWQAEDADMDCKAEVCHRMGCFPCTGLTACKGHTAEKEEG